MSPPLIPSGSSRTDLAAHPDAVFVDGAGKRIAALKTVLAQIFAEVDRGLHMLQRGGMEIGGLLAGQKRQGAGFLVEEAIPLLIEYQSGPVFELSPTELDHVVSTVRSLQEPEPRAVVGFYRSITRGRDSFLESDREVLEAIRQCDPASAAVHFCLLFTPLSRQEMSVRVILYDGIHWDHTDMTIRRESFQVYPAGTLLPAQTRNVPEPQTKKVAALRRGGAFARLKPANGYRNLGLYVMMALVALMAGSNAYRWFVSSRAQGSLPKKSQAQSSQPADHLGFSADRDGPAWRLTWNRDVVGALDPVGATLSIRDGASERDIALTPADLSSGTLYYNPQGGELAFRLEIEKHGGEAVAERIQVLQAAAPADQGAGSQGSASAANRPAAVKPRVPATPSPAPASAPNAKAATSAPATAAAVTKSAPPAPNVADARVPEPPVSPAPSTPPAITQTKAANLADALAQSSLRQGANESAGSQASPSPVSVLAVPMPAPAKPAAALPSAPVNQASTIPAPSTQPTAPAVVPPPAAAPPKEISTPRVASAQPAGASGTLTPNVTSAPAPARAPAAPKQASYQGPRPIRQVTPATPPGVALAGPMQVQVLVAIDAKGKVTKVTPVGQQANVQLLSVAARAAEYWQFEPARQDGQAVPSAMTLIFKF